MPVARNHMEDGELDAVKWTTQIQFEPVFNPVSYTHLDVYKRQLPYSHPHP